MDDDRFPPEQRPLVATLTLGCKLNQAESQAMGRELAAAGCAIIDRPAPADGYLINTCTVTHVADRKARHLIRMARRLSPTAAIVVTGCYAEWARDRILAETGADVVLGNGEKHGAAAALLSALEGRPSQSGLKGRDALGRARTFLKIQEGCDDVCSFCIVPKVRGRERAIPISEIVREAQSLERAGALEVVLTGTQPGAYGRDREDGTNAARLLEALLSQTTIPRIRYSSIQPQDVSAEFLAAWEDSRLCRHFHLALQSGSDAVLRRMRRRYDVTSYLEAVGRIRAAAAGAAITTDVIVGFPGETPEDFERTIAAAREVQFADIHVFPYSARPGTGAAFLTDDVPPPIKRERVQRVQAEADSGAAKFRRAMVGSVVSVLCEMRKRDGGRTYWAGLTDTYAPVQVAAAGGEDLRNRLTAVCIESLRGGALEGRMLG